MSSNNNSITINDIIQASQIRKEYEQRFSSEPVFTHARATLDKADHSSDNTSFMTTSISRQNRKAMSDLKKCLASIRNVKSNNSSPSSPSSSFFTESLPTTRGESTIRILVASDVVNDSIPVSNPPTSVTINIRPFNQEAFKLARNAFFSRTEKEGTPNPPDILFGIKIRAKLTSQNDEKGRKKILNTFDTIERLMPPHIRERTSLSVGHDGFLTITIAEPSNSSEPSEDPFEKVILAVARLTSSTRLCDSDFIGNKISPVDVFRLATIRVDIPHDLSEWLRSRESSWITLTEGMRVAAEAITRDASSEDGIAELARTILGGSNQIGDKMANSLLLLLLSAIRGVKENSLFVRAASPELLFALGVEDASVAHRMAFLADLAERNSPEQFRGTPAQKDVDDFLRSTGLEEQVAATLSSILNLGATSTRLQRILIYAAGATLLDEGASNMIPLLDSLFLPIRDMIEEINSVSMISKSGYAEIDLKGFNRKLWNWIPATSQGVSDLFKTLCLASWPRVTFSEDGTQLLDQSTLQKIIPDGSKKSSKNAKPFFEIDKSCLVQSPFVFVAAMDQIIKTSLESIWPVQSGNRPPDFVLRNPVMSFQKAQRKTCFASLQRRKSASGRPSSSSPSPSPSSVWDFPLPDELTNFDKGYAVGVRTLEISRIIRKKLEDDAQRAASEKKQEDSKRVETEKKREIDKEVKNERKSEIVKEVKNERKREIVKEIENAKRRVIVKEAENAKNEKIVKEQREIQQQAESEKNQEFEKEVENEAIRESEKAQEIAKQDEKSEEQQEIPRQDEGKKDEEIVKEVEDAINRESEEQRDIPQETESEKSQEIVMEVEIAEHQQNSKQHSSLFENHEIETLVKSQFDKFDEDKSGYLERSEAMSLFICFYPDASTTQILARLQAADFNHDGRMDYVEFSKIVKDILNGGLQLW